VPKRAEADSLVKLLLLLNSVLADEASSTSQFSMASEVLMKPLCSSVNDPANLTLEKSITVAPF
jgi:hypothetical protein